MRAAAEKEREKNADALREMEKKVSCKGSTAAPSGARSNLGSAPTAHVATFVTVKGWVVDYGQKSIQAKSKEVLMAWLKDDVVPQLSQELAASVDLDGTDLLNSYATLFKMDIAIRGRSRSSCCIVRFLIQLNEAVTTDF